MPGITACSVNVGGTASRRGSAVHACSKTATTSAAAIRANGNDFTMPGVAHSLIRPMKPMIHRRRFSFALPGEATIEAQRAGAVRHQQQEATGDRHVLEEHDHLDLVGEVGV